MTDVPRKLPPFLHRETTRHGRSVWYFRRGKLLSRALLKKLNEDNCERYGVSKIEISRLREAAFGGR